MTNHGDITQIHGGNVEPAWVVIGGSPCQDLSVAGKRAGLEGERSGLFMDQIRVIKEMRWHDRSIGRTDSDVRPRWMVWENVPGAFSSDKGEDFRAVIEETARVAEEWVTIPRPADGKWQTAGCVVGDGWSIAWRVLDAQFWGVPQRRRRIALVADFAGQSAGEILFKREGLSGYPETGGEAREGSAGDAGECAPRTVRNERGVFWLNPRTIPDIADTLKARHDGSPNPDIHSGQNVVFCLQGNGIDRADTAGCNGCGWREDKCYTLNTIDRPAVAFCQNQREEVRELGDKAGAIAAELGIHQQTFVYAFKGQAGSGAGSAGVAEDVSPTLLAEQCGFPSPCVCTVAIHQNADGEIRESDVAYTISTNGNASGRNTALCYDSRGNGEGDTVPTLTEDHENRVTDYTALCIGNGQTNNISMNDKANTLDTMHDQQAILECRNVAAVDCRNGVENPDVNGTLQAKPSGGTSLNLQNVVRLNKTVRRLTPLECERLQGYPDGWTDIGEWHDAKVKKHDSSDSARYKALGNPIALPPWRYVLSGIYPLLPEDEKTMASLFDGIGGFPLIWKELGGTTVWTSEIEPFCCAVTAMRFE